MNRKTPGKSQYRSHVHRRIETLDDRIMLASDFVYDQSSALIGFQGRLAANASEIRLLNTSDNSVFHSVLLSDFTGTIDIKGSPHNDTLVFDSSLSGLNAVLQDVKFDGGPGSDTATVEGDLETRGKLVSLTAETITVNAGGSISTRSMTAGVTDADSGNITLTGKTVTLQTGAGLLAGVTKGSSSNPGDIEITVEDKPTAAESVFGDILLPILVANRVATVTATGAEIDGGDVKINASSSTQTRWDDLGEYSDNIAEQLLGNLGSFVDVIGSLISPLTGQVKVQKATGEITLTDAKITASRDVEIAAASESNASFVTVGVNSLFATTLPFIINVGYGETLAKANVNVGGTTEISADGDVSVTSSANAEAGVVSRSSANGRASNSDAVDVAISLGIAVQNQESTVMLDDKAKIVSTQGSVEFNATGEGETSAEGEAVVFRDGVAGLAVGVAIEHATIRSEVNGTILAARPQGDAVLAFTPANVVNVTDDSITLANIDKDQEITRGQELVYRALGNTAIAGLEDGGTYVVADVENVPAGDTFTGTQKIWLANSMPLELDIDQVQPDATHTLAQLALAEFPATAVTSDADANLTIDVAGLSTGDKAKYLGPNSPVTEKNFKARFQRNAAGDQMIRTDGGKSWKSLGLHVGQTFELQNAAGDKTPLSIKGFSSDGNTIILNQVNLVNEGEFSTLSINTTPETPTGIGNLVQGTEYEVVVQSGKVLLKDPADPTKFVQFTNSGTGVHGFSYTKNRKSFVPKTAVDGSRDTIEMAAHGFQTGDLLVYRTDPTKPISRPLTGFLKSTPDTPIDLGTVQLPDAPIDGLDTGFYYYVTRVDANRIRLSVGSVNAARAEVIDLASAPAGTHDFVLPNDSTGIDITATLEASNSATSGVALSDGEQPWPDVVAGAGTGQAQSLFAGMVGAKDFITNLRSKAGTTANSTTPTHDPNAPCRPSTPAPGADTGVPLEFAGTFSVNFFKHTVEAKVGPKAELKSGKDINVVATIEEETGVTSISEATRNGLDSSDTSDTGEAREDIEISVAFGLGINKNYARAIIDAGAVVDASGALAVESSVEYPLRADFSADSNINPAEAIKNEGLDGFAFLLDGTLGIGSNIFNTWVSSLGGDPGSSSADKFVLGVGVGVQIFDNESTARIGSGAKINQDAAYRTTTQSVSVNAETLLTMVDVGHIAAFNLSLPGLVEAGGEVLEGGNPLSVLQGIVNPFGVSGQNAIGASVLVIDADNKTTAEISSSALVHTGTSGDGLSVTANQEVLTIAVAMTGGKASEFGLSPSVTVGIFDTKTTAFIGAGAQVTGGGINVDAEDTLSRYGIDGGFLLGQKIGVGVAVGVNIIDRVTLAYIGSDSPDTDSLPAVVGAAPHIDVSGPVNVTATEKGKVFALALAAAVLTEPTNKPTSKQPATDSEKPDPACGQGGGLGGLGGAKGFGATSLGNTQAAGILDDAIPQTTFAAGVSVAFNDHESTVKAFIDDPSVRAESVAIEADSDIEFRAIVIGGAVNTRAGSNNAGVGAAIAVNNLENSSVEAYIRDADIITTGTGLTTPTVKVQATNHSTIYSDGGGIALVIASGATQNTNNLAVGISVAINAIETDVLAFVDHSPIDASGDVLITANLTPTIDALTFAGSLAVSTGGAGNALNIAGAGAASKNVIRAKAHAYIVDTDPADAAGINTRNGGDVTVSAMDESKIIADAGGVSVAAAFGQAGNFTNLGFGVAVAINEITNDVAAYIKDSSVDSNGDLKLKATSHATIDALTIGGALTDGASFSGAGSGNTTRNVTWAYIDGGTGVNGEPAIQAAENVDIAAHDESKIIADAGGVSVVINIIGTPGDAQSGSLGIGAAVNNIENKVLADIFDTTLTAKTVAVEAKSTAVIDVLSIAGAAGVNFAEGSSFSFNGAGAGSGNTIKNTIRASINDLDDADGDTSVRSTTGAITVSALDDSKVKADAGAVAFALGISQGNSNINLSVGVSIAINEVKNTVLAHIDDADVGAAGSVDVSAKSTSSIEALTIAGAGALGLQPSGASGFGLQFAGAGTGSGNNIDGSTEAYISHDAEVSTSAGSNVTVTATDTSTIKATAVSGSISAQLATGASIAIGASIAKNTIDSDVLAYIDDAVVDSAGSVIVSAISSSRIDALTVAVAFSLNISSGDSVSIAGSGAGAQSTNTVTNTIQASIRGGSQVTTAGIGDVKLSAADDSTIKADSGGGSLAVSASPQAFSGAFGVSAGLSYNTVRNSILAYIDGSTTKVESADEVVITADSTAKVDALAVSVAGAVAIVNPLAGFSLAMVGAGSESNNTIDNTISAYVGDFAFVESDNDIVLKANDDAKIKAVVPAVSFVVSLGVGLSNSVTLSNNTISNKVDAYIGGSQVESSDGNIMLDAQSNGKVEAFATAISLNISIGASGQGGKAVSQITGHTMAHLDAGANIQADRGEIVITSTSTSYTNAENKGGGLGLVSITALLAESTISASTKAYIAGATVNSGGLTISSKAFGKDGVTARTAKSKVVAGTVAVVGGGGGKATSTVSGAVEAYISNGSTVNINRRVGSNGVTSGAIEVKADSTSVADADTPGGSGGGVTVTALIPEATTSGATRAYVDRAGLSANRIDILSTANNLANSHLLVANVSLVGGGGGKATAKQLADTEAYATRATLATPIRGIPGSVVNVEALSTSNARAKAEGGGFGVINASAFESLATIGESDNSATTAAYLGSGVNLANFFDLKIDAEGNNTATSDLLSVSIGGAGISSAHAKTNVYADTEAYIGLKDFGFPVAITMPPGIGGVDVNARSRTNVNTSETAGGGGGLAIGSAFTETNLAGTTTAFIGDSTNIVARDINVHSEILGATASANLLAATGGLVSIGSTKATVDAKPKSIAYIGKQANVNANNIDILAIGRGEADAKSNSSGGGVVQIGVANAKSIIDPTVDAYIGEGSNVTAGGNVKVHSMLVANIANPPSDIIRDTPDDADTLAVDVDQDTVDFNVPVQTGDQLTYLAPLSIPLPAPSFGLTNLRAYNVIVVQPGQKLQLGDEFDGSKVDGDSDRITFNTPHTFAPGDAVRYNAHGGLSIVEPWQTTLPTNDPNYVDPNGLLYVRGIFADPADPLTLDQLSIRLARTSAAATASEASLLKPFDASGQIDTASEFITLDGHGFEDGQAVTYRAAASSTFLTEAVDVNVVDRTTKDANGNTVVVKDVERNKNGVGLHFNNQNILVPGHKFSTGDAVTYRSTDPIGGLTSGSTYYVIKVDANQIKLAATYHQAVGLPFDDRGTSDSADDILGISVTPIQLNPSSDPSQVHQLSRNLKGLVDGNTYYVASPTADTFQLAATQGGSPIELDHSDDINLVQRNGSVASTIRPLTRGGSHFVGSLGIDLRPGTGTQSLRIDLTGQPTGGDHRLLGAVSSIALGDGKSTADGLGGSGGAIDVNVPTGNLTSTQTITAHIDATSVTAGGNVEIVSKSLSSVSSKADTGGGGIASIGEAHSDTVVTATTNATVGNSTRIQAGRDFLMVSDSNQTSDATAKAVGGGAFAVKVAETTAKITGNTESKIGDGAQVSAGGLLSVDSTSSANGNSNSETYAVAYGAFADSDNTNGDRGVTIKSPTKVTVGKGATLEAESVDLNANIGSITGTARASAKAFSPIFFGVVTAFADASVDVDANASVLIDANAAGSSSQTTIIGRGGVDIQAHHPDPSDSTRFNIQRNPTALAVALIPPQGSRELGTATATSTIDAKSEALIVAGTRGAGTPLVTRPSVPELALYVDADTKTTWNADVEIRGGASPELIIDADGNITKQVNVNANVNSAFQTVNVTGVTVTGPGQVLFEGDGTVAGSQGTFSFRRTLDRVDITTNKYQMIVGDLNVANKDLAGTEPKVTLDVPTVALEFDVDYSFKPTEITIQNFDPAPDQGIGIRLTGLIDNPIGTTKLIASGGIYSENFRDRKGVVRTNRLVIEAGTDAGDNFPNTRDRIPIDIVESPGLPAHMSVTAGSDINVGIQGLQRGPSSASFTTTKDANPSLFMAGEKADIMLLGGLQQNTVTVPATFGIQVFETSRVKTPLSVGPPTTPATAPRTTKVTNHFRVSTGNSVSLPAGVFGTGNTPIDVTYDLGLIKAGTSIDVYKDDPVTSRVNILSDTNLVGPNSINIDSRTNGFIDLTETDGDLRVGQIRSTAGDVSLAATAGSIADVPDDLNVAGDTAADAIGINLKLTASQLIGFDSNRFEIDSSNPTTGVVDATAQNAIYLVEVDDGDANDDDFLNVGLIQGLDVTLEALRGGIFDAKNDFAADVVGNHIELLATRRTPGTDAIGQTGNDLEIDSSYFAGGHLIARSNGNIRITETNDELYIRNIAGIDGATRPDAFITVRDTGSNRNDMVIRGQNAPGFFVPGTIEVRDAFLTAGDDFQLPVDGTINASRAVDIKIDPVTGDPDGFGSWLELDTRITASTLQLTGGDDFDTFETVLHTLQAGNEVKVFGGEPRYPVYPGDRLLVDTQGNNVSHPPIDQASVEQGSGILTSPGFSSINYVSIELINRIPPSVPTIDSNHEFPFITVPLQACVNGASIDFSAANGNPIRVFDYDETDAITSRIGLVVFQGSGVNRTPAGTLTLLDPDLPTSGNGMPGGNGLAFSGSFERLRQALANGIRYTPSPGLTGMVTIGIQIRDSHFDAVNANDFQVQLGCTTNNPPINILPAPILTDQTNVTLSSANGNKLSVADLDAGIATNFTVTLSVPTGSLLVANSLGVAIVGNGTPAQPMLLTGSLASINVALAAGVQLAVPVGFTGVVPLTIVSNDNGNTGSGGPKTDTDVLNITIGDLSEANDPPVNHLPGNVAATYFFRDIPVVLSGANAIRVTDIDAGNADNFLVSLSVPFGKLSLDNSTGVTVAGKGLSADPLTLTGTLANINTVLANGLRYLPPYDNFLGPVPLVVVSNDRGNSGTGGPLTDADVMVLRFIASPVNAPPVNQLPAPVTTSEVPYLFSVANGNNLFVTDVDAGNSTNFFVSLSVASGNLELVNPTGITALFGNGSAAAPLGLRGTLASINEVLARGLVFLPGGPAGMTTLTIVSNDGGATGTGGPLSDTDTLSITVVDGDPANNPPVNHVPGTVTTEKLPIVFSQVNGNPLFVTDIDAGNNDIMVKLTTPDGRLYLASSNNLAASGVGTVDSPLMLTGTLTNINSALLSGLTFVPKGGFTGTTSLTINSNDQGNTGTGGPLQDTDSVLINVIDANIFVNDPPVNHLPPNVTTSQVPVVFSETNGNMIAVTDVDAGDANDFMVSLSVANGILSLGNKTGLTLSGNGSSATPLMLTGKLADIDSALAAGLTFFPSGGFVGTTTLTVVSNDKGNSGSGGELTDTDSFTITIVDPNPGVNNPPVNHLPPPIESDQLPTLLSYENNNFLHVTDVDSGTTPNFMVSLSVPVGTLFLVSKDVVTVTGDGTPSSPLMLTGLLDNINKALLTGVQFLPPAGFLGSTKLTIHSNDKGQFGVFGTELTDTDELDIKIVDNDPNNNPPVNHLPPPVTSDRVPFFLSAANGNHIYVTDIDVGNASNFSVSLTLAEGKLKLPNSTGLTVSGNGTAISPLTVTGTLADINTALTSGLQVLPFGDYLSGKTLLTITSNDNGNTGIGGPGIDIDTLEITIVDTNPNINDPPENHVITPVVTTNVPYVFSDANGNELFVTDIDAGTANNFMVTLSVDSGSLSIASMVGLTKSGAGTAASPLMLTGKLDDINNALSAGLSFLPASGTFGTSIVTMVSNDKGNTGAGGEKTDTSFISITINDADPNNNPPINHVPADFATDGIFVVLSETNGNKLSVSDVDAGNATDFMVTLSVSDGDLSLISSTDLTVLGSGTVFDPLMLTGTLANINARLADGLQVTATGGNLGVRTVSITSNDKGNRKSDGTLGDPLSDSDSFDITIASPVNDPPINKLPTPFETNQLPVILSGATGNALSVSDVDAGDASDFMVTLSVDVGTLQLANSTGLTVGGNGTAATPLMMTGKLTDINGALNSGLRFRPPGGYVGMTVLTMVSDDNGNSGGGGPLTDTDTLEITIKDFDVPNNQPPINHLPPSVSTTQTPVVFSEANGNQLYVTDIDAGSANNFMVSLSVVDGMLILSNRSELTMSGDGTTANPLMLTGTLAKIDEALAAGVQFVANGFLGTTTLTIKSDDKGNTGFGGAKTDTDTLTITISDSDGDINDPPVNHLPAPIVTSNVPVELSQANGNPLFVTDIDAGNASDFTVQLDVGQDGTLTLLNRTGLTVSGDGSIFRPLLLTGSLDTINRRLVEGLRYVPTGGFQGTATLSIFSNDNGNTGDGGAKTDLDTLSITIVDGSPENDPPVNVLPNSVTFGQLRAFLSSDTGNAISVTDIDAGSASNFMVSLSVADGQLSLFDKRNLTVSGNGTPGSLLKLTGTLADINERLARGLEFIPGRFGSTILTITSDDQGNTGTGGAKTDTDTLALNLIDDNQPINDPPVNYVPLDFTTSQLPVVLSELNLNQLSVADIDAGNATNFMVTLSVPTGELSLTSILGLNVSGNGTNSVMLTGSIADINVALAAGLQFLPTAPFVGQTILTITSNDKGNTGLGGPKTATNGVTITIADANSANNDAPVNHLPPPVVSNQLPTVLSHANGNKLVVTDIDAGNANNFMVSLSVPLGRLSLVSDAGVTMSGNGAPATPLMLTGTLQNINAALANGLSFLPPTGFLGKTQLTIVSNDKGNTGAGGEKTDTDVLDIEIGDLNPANDPPVNHLPAPITTSQIPVVLSSANSNELYVTDIDAGNAANFRVTLTVTNGLLTLSSAAGLVVSGNDSAGAPLIVTGALADINSALANGLQFNPAGFVGTTTLTIVSNDRGNSGPGGPLTDTDTLTITVTDNQSDVNDPPVNQLPAPITSNSTAVVMSAANGNALSVSDVDAGNANNFQVTLTIGTGSLALTSEAGISASGNGSAATPLTLVGTLANINVALAAGFTFQTPNGFIGTTILTMVSNDQGNTGAGGPLTDTDTLAITITADANPAVNDPPVNHLPTPISSSSTVIVMSAANGNALFVTDVDAGNANNFQVTLTIGTGSLALTSEAGISASGNGSAATPLTLVGTLANINVALAAGFTFQAPNGFIGTTTLTMVSNDQGNTGAGGPLTDTDTLAITITADTNPAVNDPPINHLPAPISSSSTVIVMSAANGNTLSVTDIDAGNASNFRVILTIGTGSLDLNNATGVSASGNGSVATPLTLVGTLANINAALAAGLTYQAPNGFTGTTLLTIVSNDKGNTGTGGELTDTDTLNITIVDGALPKVVAVIADSSSWTTDFRDFVDGGFADPSARGYPIPNGPQQLETLPWINIDRLKVVFSEDVGSSLAASDFQLTAAPGFTALGIPPGASPTIVDLLYDASTFTATLMLNKSFPAAVVDLSIIAAGVTDSDANPLDGEWQNAVTTGSSGNNNPGGDFSFRIFVLPGDTFDESGGVGARTVNSNDAQRVRDRQNGFALSGFGAFGYDARSDLDGNSFVNTDDSQYERGQQNAIIFRSAPPPVPAARGARQQIASPAAVDAVWSGDADTCRFGSNDPRCFDPANTRLQKRPEKIDDLRGTPDPVPEFENVRRTRRFPRSHG